MSHAATKQAIKQRGLKSAAKLVSGTSAIATIRTMAAFPAKRRRPRTAGGFVQGEVIEGDTIKACYVRISEFNQLAGCEEYQRSK